MAVQAQYGGLASVPPACLSHANAAYEVEAQLRAMHDYGVLLSAAANNSHYCAAVASGAQSELTCNNGAGGALVAPRNKRGREAERYVSPSSALLLPIPGMAKAVAPAASGRLVESAMTSTSGRPSAAAAPASSFADTLVPELCRHSAEIDATVRMECERMRARLERARKRQCQSLVRVVSAAAVRRLREKEAELVAARRRVFELEERLRQAAAESQAWCGLARSNEAVAAGLRSTLDQLLGAAPAPAEGFGESDFTSPAALVAADDVQSCCFEEPKENAGAYKWACMSCGEGEATVLLLPCRHLCLCKACEPRLDACPVCLAAKNASVHIAMN